jgi:hypothetical protein
LSYLKAIDCGRSDEVGSGHPGLMRVTRIGFILGPSRWCFLRVASCHRQRHKQDHKKSIFQWAHSFGCRPECTIRHRTCNRLHVLGNAPADAPAQSREDVSGSGAQRLGLMRLGVLFSSFGACAVEWRMSSRGCMTCSRLSAPLPARPSRPRNRARNEVAASSRRGT